MSSITEDLKRTFDLASFRQRAKSLTRPADLEKMSEITKRYARETNKQEKLHKRDYTTRIEKETAMIEENALLSSNKRLAKQEPDTAVRPDMSKTRGNAKRLSKLGLFNSGE